MKIKACTAGFLTLALLTGLLSGCGAAETASSAEEGSVFAAKEAAAAPTPTPEPEPASEALSIVEEAPTKEQLSAIEEVPAEADPERFFQDYLTEPEVSEMYAEVADKFELREYYDQESGLTISYHLFVPAQANEPLPMVMFIGDATTVSPDPQRSLNQGYGGIIWATESEQEKHPSYVLVPAFQETVIDDNSGAYISDYVDATARMVMAVAAENNVDTNRIYTTGQSMGCMTSLYLAANYPDLFAAELFVSGQWDTAALQGLESQTFFYVAAGGDMKASGGQADVMADFDDRGITYSASYGWDANLDDAALEPALREIISQGTARNFGQFAAGTVSEANPRGIEHMSSFDCTYKLDVLRNWLFAQSK